MDLLHFLSNPMWDGIAGIATVIGTLAVVLPFIFSVVKAIVLRAKGLDWSWIVKIRALFLRSRSGSIKRKLGILTRALNFLGGVIGLFDIGLLIIAPIVAARLNNPGVPAIIYLFPISFIIPFLTGIHGLKIRPNEWAIVLAANTLFATAYLFIVIFAVAYLAVAIGPEGLPPSNSGSTDSGWLHLFNTLSQFGVFCGMAMPTIWAVSYQSTKIGKRD